MRRTKKHIDKLLPLILARSIRAIKYKGVMSRPTQLHTYHEYLCPQDSKGPVAMLACVAIAKLPCDSKVYEPIYLDPAVNKRRKTRLRERAKRSRGKATLCTRSGYVPHNQP